MFKKGENVDKYIQLKNKRIGDGQPCYIIAEMSANHGGDFNHALEIVYAAAESGANCIKLQTYTADTITMNSKKEHFIIDDGLWKGENLYSLYQKAYTPWDWHPRIKEEAEKLGLDFLSTPFDPTAVNFLEQVGVEFYKISSFEVVDIPLLKAVAVTGKPILLSVGMASESEIAAAVGAIRKHGGQVPHDARAPHNRLATLNRRALHDRRVPLNLHVPHDRRALHDARAPRDRRTLRDRRALHDRRAPLRGLALDNLILLKCSSAYPAAPADMNLLTLQYLKQAFNAAVGLSDHSMGSLSACTAVALGATVIEKHFCTGRAKKTPDSEFSMEPKEFKEMVENIRMVEQSLGKVSFEPTAGEAVSRLHRKSIFVTADVKKGDTFTPDNIRVIRPAQGIPPSHYDEALGKAATTDIEAGTPLKHAHIGGYAPNS